MSADFAQPVQYNMANLESQPKNAEISPENRENAGNKPHFDPIKRSKIEFLKIFVELNFEEALRLLDFEILLQIILVFGLFSGLNIYYVHGAYITGGVYGATRNGFLPAESGRKSLNCGKCMRGHEKCRWIFWVCRYFK